MPPGATIVGVPGHVAGGRREEPSADLEHARLPDPVLRTLSETLEQQSRLEERVRELEQVISRAQLPAAPVPQHTLSPADEASIRHALQEVIDPEVGINVVDLGFIREIKLNGQGVEVCMVICEGCSLAGHLIEQERVAV